MAAKNKRWCRRPACRKYGKYWYVMAPGKRMGMGLSLASAWADFKERNSLEV